MAYWKHYTCVLFCAMTLQASTITTGYINMALGGMEDNGTYSLLVDGVTLHGTANLVGSFETCPAQCAPSLVFSAGIEYPINDANYALYATQIFLDGPALIPAPINNSTQQITVPFTAHGAVNATPLYNPNIPVPAPACIICNETVTGSGTVTATVGYYYGTVTVSNLDFTFTPEPGTAFLFLPLLAIAGAYRRLVTPTKDGRGR